MSQRWRDAPRGGSPRSSWRRSRCRAETTSPASSPASPVTTATSSTTWSRRSCSVSPSTSRPSCCRPRSSTGSAVRCATPSPVRPAARPCWRRSTAATCSWSRSTTAAGGTATTTSSPTCCEHACSTSSPTWSPTCTGGRATGTRRTASGPWPSSTPWPPRTSSERPTWSSWRPRRCSGAGRRARCVAGWRRIPEAQLPGQAGAQQRLRRVPACPPARSRASSRACGTPSGGWTPCRPRVADLTTGRRTWWSWTRRRSGGCPRGSPSTAPGRRWCSATAAGCITHARRALDLAGRRRPPRARSSVGAHRARVVGRRGRRGGAGGVRRVVEPHAAGRPHRRRPRSGDHAGGHPDRPGPARRRDAHLRAGAAARRGAGRAGPARNGRHVRRDGRAPPRARRPAGRHASSCGAARSSASTSGCRRTRYRWRVAMARVREAEGDLDGAVDLLDDAERVYAGDFSPDVRPIPAMRARVWLAQGRLDDARRLGARARAVRRGRPQLPARVRARHPGEAAAGPVPDRARRELRRRRRSRCLQRLLQAAEEGGRTGSVIEILVLQALAHQRERRHRGRAGAAGTRPDAGRTRGLRPGLRRRGRADGRPAGDGRASAGSPRATSGGC